MGPRWIKQWISELALLNEQFRNDDGTVDFEALGREEYAFRVALMTKKFAKSERAKTVYTLAEAAYDSSVKNGKKGGRPKKLNGQETASGNDQRRAGGHLLPSSSLNCSPARSGAVDVLNLAYAGEFGNVLLTQEQYAQLGIKFGNQQKLNRAIDSLSCQIENGEKNPQNHYAELVKWASYREDMEEQKEEEAGKPKLSKMEQSWINTFKAIERM